MREIAPRGVSKADKVADTKMKPQDRAVIVYYDAETGVLKGCATFLSKLEPVIQQRVSVDLPFDSHDAITDEDARKIGGYVIMLIAGGEPELREKLQITTSEPMDWTPIKRPE